ncbi:hypothetical protein NEDG_00113 [Nematocida displodere]|uniref:Transcriptional activator HAP2 n=1 Tax=Nematocida displodere TaxID=1805483 RepID=A0A177EIB5_9MICR|nr:hypothetical protein NEDG_00113 [Nematocida displodere]
MNNSSNNSPEYRDSPALPFSIEDLPIYGYTYKDEEKPFGKSFSFSMAENPKYPEDISDDPAYFLNKYSEQDHTSQMASQISQMASQMRPGATGVLGEPKELDFAAYMDHRQRKMPAQEYSNNYDFRYNKEEEQAVFVNASQYPYIKRRKERRDHLDTLQKKKDVAYQHESRHKHAMKRPRAPSGRFLTKEEASPSGGSFMQ